MILKAASVGDPVDIYNRGSVISKVPDMNAHFDVLVPSTGIVPFKLVLSMMGLWPTNHGPLNLGDDFIVSVHKPVSGR